jgi:prepilin-type N-terminal cleavage/methylation domain-containing protein
MKQQYGFTLVELLIVIVILAIVSTIWFIAYEDYLIDARDGKRISQVSLLRDGMRTTIAKKSLPLPDNAIEIRNNGNVFLYQGYAWADVLETIWFSDDTKDPKDEVYYTYMLSKNKRDFQLMTFLEKENEEVLLWTNSQVHAWEYEERFPKTMGKKLWILLSQQDNTPIQEMSTYDKRQSGSGFMDLTSPTTNIFTAYITDSEKLFGKEYQLLGIMPFMTCKKILETGGSVGDGLYTVNPSGNNPFKTYCDMTTDGGGWMFTTFVSQLGGTFGLFQWTAAWGAYYFDRREWVSYGLNTAEIPHTEMYFIIDEPTITPQALVERRVMNIQYDYRYPLFSIPYVQGTPYAMRFWFEDDFVNNNFIWRRDNTTQWYEVQLRKPLFTWFWISMEESGFDYPSSIWRLPESFYNYSLDTDSAGKKNTWFYIR